MMAQTASRRGVKLLEQLPHVFHVSELVAMRYTDATARVALSRWEKRGLVEGLGAHSGLYINSMRHSDVPVWAAALAKLYPHARIIGEMALNLGGWLPEAPARIEVAIHPKRMLPTFAEVTYTHRGKRWLKHTQVGGQWNGVDVLSPESAWCDILAFERHKAVRIQSHGLRIPEGVSVERLRREAIALERVAPLPGARRSRHSDRR